MPAYHLLDDIIVPYMRETSHERKRSTQEREACHERVLRRLLGDYYLCDEQSNRFKTVTGAVVSWYRDTRKIVDGVSARTVESELALASVAVNHAISEWNHEITNPFHKRLISKKDRQTKRRRKWHRLTKAEEQRLLMAADQVTRDIVMLALQTGMRQSEILNLQWDQVRGNRIHFAPEQQKANRDGVTVLNSVAQEIIERRAKAAVCEYVFDYRGRKIHRRRFHRWWEETRKRAGIEGDIKLQFRDTRNNSGQRVLEATGELTMVKYHLRHAQIRTTEQSYVEEPIDLMEAAAEKIARL